MAPQEQKPQNWKTLLESYVKQHWKTLLVCISIVVTLIALISLFSNIWTNRYEAGYAAGAGEGAAFKPLYEQAQVELRDLRAQHERDLEIIADQEKRIGQLEGRKGYLKPSEVTQNQAEETLNQVSKQRTEVEQQRSDTFNQSIEIGKAYGRLEELEKSNQQLLEEKNHLQMGNRVREVFIVILFIIVVWFSSRKTIIPPNSYNPRKEVFVSAIEADRDPGLRNQLVPKIEANDIKGYLPEKSESSSDSTDPEETDKDVDDTADDNPW